MSEQYEKLINKLLELDKRLKESKVKSEVFPLTGELLDPPEELEKQITHLIKKTIVDITEDRYQKFINFVKSLSLFGGEALQKIMQKLEEFVEEQADSDTQFDVSDTNHIDRFISCLQTALPFFARDAPRSKFLNCLNKNIMPAFDQLPQERKLNLLRALAEISPYTTAEEARHMLPSIVQLLKKYMPAKKLSEALKFTYVECLLYVFHHLAYKAPNETNSLCGYKIGTGQQADIPEEDSSERSKDFRKRLTTVEGKTLERVKNLAQTLIEQDKAILVAKRNKEDSSTIRANRQITKTELRTCNNIQAMTKLLKAKTQFFLRDANVPLSWKEVRKPLATRRRTMPKASNRPDSLLLLPQEYKDLLNEYGFCQLNEDCVNLLVDLPRLREAQEGTIEGPFYLNDDGQIAVLCCEMRETELLPYEHLNKGVLWNSILGEIRHQMYHLLCWAYAASDQFSAARQLHKWDQVYSPLCTWYLCSYCDPESLKQHEEEGRDHHCYGYTIEGALLHIQRHGIPREVVSEFNCTDHEPVIVDDLLVDKGVIKDVRTINTLEEALQWLPEQPIGADLIHYTGMGAPGKIIYYGPKTHGSVFQGYHSVIITSLERIGKELVAVCKSSQGYDVGDNGYIYVSLKTLYIPVGVNDKQRDFVRGYSEFVHLLTNFVIIEMDVKEGEDETEDEKDDSETEEKQEDNPEEKPEEKREEDPEEKEYEEYVPKAKRHRPCYPNRSRLGLSYFVAPAQLHHKVAIAKNRKIKKISIARSNPRKGKKELTRRGSEDAKPVKPKVYTDKCTAFLSNLSVKAQEEDIRKFFSDAGGVVSVHILHQKDTEKPRGLAYVDFLDDEHLTAAIAKNREIFLGKKISIARSNPKKGKKDFTRRGSGSGNSKEKSKISDKAKAPLGGESEGTQLGDEFEVRENTFAVQRTVKPFGFTTPNLSAEEMPK